MTLHGFPLLLTAERDSATLFVEIDPFDREFSRSGDILIGNQTLMINQLASGCSFVLLPSSTFVPASGGEVSVHITVDDGKCYTYAWSNEPWITGYYVGTTKSILEFNVAPNDTGAERVGTLAISGETFTVNQSAVLEEPTLAAFTNAASYHQGALAPDEIVTLWGTNMANSLILANSVPLPTELGGTSVTFMDSAGTQHTGGLLYVSGTQTSLVMPSGMAHGPATASITTPSGTASMAVQIARTDPGIFAANENGQGAPAGTALLVKPDNSRTSQFLFNDSAPAGGRNPVPVNMGNEGDQVYLILYGTGIRWNLPKVTATVDGLSVGAVALAHPVFVGLDQINIGPLPRNLLGHGNVEVVLTMDGVAANPVTINIP